ncbi:hypothetical protein QBC47DRAFT_299742 [Echria macrotheca]|uniref:Mannan endo-1,6-alpha-mannosidase n=1 Tax=Echria macrotheca TaxID=438768 RepID=A0AAJ0BFF7_9PEZI|nr:hypothetical protein QBC47DRAFT_299742 [Echria macrotheca]
MLHSWGGLIARATALLAQTRSSDSAYIRNTQDAVRSLQGWYNTSTGLWATTGWWNSANCLTVLADWALLDTSGAASLNITTVMSNTFTKAQQTPAKVEKRLSSDGLILTYDYTPVHQLQTRGFSGFINEFYDDEGWWALGWIHSWDLTHEPRYLDMAESIFEDMHNGTDDVCGGGIWWSKERKYKNAIANELYLSVAASLSNRVPARKAQYVDLAKRSWAWFKSSGMINKQNLINDGLTINANGTCVNNGFNTWSYNQGVVLGGLVELAHATGDKSYLDEATAIAKAAITLLSDKKTGILVESGGCEPNCGGDGSQFKGIFVRNLRYLQAVAPQDEFRSVILANADSIWANSRDDANRLGVSWAGPVSAGGGPNASTHSSAMDVLVAAVAVV